jgi:hypothetical protein
LESSGVNRDGSESWSDSDDNPYQAPRAPIGRGKRRGHSLGDFPGDVTQPLSVTHDLYDDDLRRLSNFDTFYDPRPLFGFIPQWVYSLAFMTAMCAATARPSYWIGAGTGAVIGLVMLGAMTWGAASNRRAALRAGLCEGRLATISPQGLRIETPHAQAVKKAIFKPCLVEGFTPWAYIRKIEISDHDLTFWKHGRIVRLIIPRHAFPTSTESEAFFQAANWWHSAATA